MKNHVHSLNNSPAKQKYSFSKEGRFKSEKPRTDIYYLPKIEHDRRSALIGMGERSLNALHTEKIYAQIPYTYDIPSTLDVKKGYSFKPGRYSIGGPLQSLKFSSQIPAPGVYDISGLQKKAITFSPKLADFSLKYHEGVPGPGAYSVPTTLKIDSAKGILQSKYFAPSSVKMAKSLDISRRSEPVTFIPGPGEYDVQKYGIGNPENPYGKNDNVKFNRDKRGSLVVRGSQKLPGPGNQQFLSNLSNIYSEFD